MHVTMFTKAFVPWNGTCQVAGRLSERLVDRGHEVTVFARDGEIERGWVDDRIEVRGLPRRPIQARRRVRQHVRRDDPDLVHSHDNLGLYAVSLPVPHVTTSHSNWPRSWVMSLRHFVSGFVIELPHEGLMHAADRVVAVSDYSRRQLARRGLDSTRVYNGIDVPETVAERDGPPSVLFVGRVDRRKARDLPAIWDATLDRTDDLTLDIVGYPADDDIVSELLELDRTRVHGTVPEIDPYYDDADALVFPSRAEACPLTVLEAQANGCPVVGFDLCSNDELVDPGTTGRLVPTYETGAFAAAIEATVTATTARDRKRCRQHVASNFSISAMTNEYVSLYEQTIEAFGGEL